jgi:hypothetical protein
MIARWAISYDSAELRDELDKDGTKPVIPNRSNRMQPFRFSASALQQTHLQTSLAHRERIQQIEGFRRIATRYDRLAL